MAGGARLPGPSEVCGDQEAREQERQCINPFTKEPSVFKARPARKVDAASRVPKED